MSTTEDRGPSLVERVKSIATGAPVVSVHCLGATTAFVLGEAEVVLVASDGDARRTTVHAGAILDAKANRDTLVTGGDDGKVCITRADGATEVVATDAKGRWIDKVAINAAGALAWSAGRDIYARVGEEEKSIALPSGAGGIAFAPKGLRIAASHYNGVTLWFPNASAAPERLEWKGSHLGLTFSPDGKFVVTAMQEAMLHGWRLADGKHMRMSGYAAKVRSMAWTADGKWLATSGSDQLILWPFQGKDGPMGKAPRLLAQSVSRAVAVACHPLQEVTAIGYADGLVLLVRLSDGAEIVVRRADGVEVTAIAWDANGTRLAYGTESGEAGILVL